MELDLGLLGVWTIGLGLFGGTGARGVVRPGVRGSTARGSGSFKMSDDICVEEKYKCSACTNW